MVRGLALRLQRGGSVGEVAGRVPLATAAAEALDGVHWIAGKIGFAAAELALLTAARYQWKVGGQLRRIAPASAVIGLAMQFTWIDAATIMHPIVGTGFFLWLVAVGAMLATGRVEQHFTAMVTASASRGRPHVG